MCDVLNYLYLLAWGKHLFVKGESWTRQTKVDAYRASLIFKSQDQFLQVNP